MHKPAPLVAFALLVFASTVAPSGNAVLTCPGDSTPDFTDSCHHEYVLYNVDQAEIDVLIVPPASPFLLRDTVILEQSVNAWDDGINSMGPAWLASGLNIHAYSLGLDAVPDAALWDPEIIIVAAEANPVLLAGIGLQAPASWCHGIPSPLSALSISEMPEFHQHEGSTWGMLSVQCGNGGRTCFVVDTNFLWLPNDDNRRDMYDLNAHEFGHCLGVGHVGDALDFTAAVYPEDDIMSYESDGHDPGHVLCVSSLNILALKQVYGDLLGQSGYPASPAGTYVHDDPANWTDATCAEPTALYYDAAPLLAADPLGL